MEKRAGAMSALLASLVFLTLGAAQSPAATTPPNIEAVMRGVDPTLLNVFYQPNLGIKNQIFDPVKTSSSSTRAATLNSFVNVEAINKCTPEISVERVQNYNQFKEALSSIFSCDTETDGTEHVTPAWRNSIAKASCSNKYFRRELDVQQFFQLTGGEIFLVTAECTTHTVSINPFEPPVFTPTFQRAIQILDYNSRFPNDESTGQVFPEFIKYYGTHFSRLTHMGAKAVFLKRFSNKSLSTRVKTDRRQCVLESAYETLTPGRRSSNETTLQHFFRATSVRCGGALHDTSVVSIGPLPVDNLEDWAHVVDKDPKPIHFTLEKISKWFTNSWFQDPLDEYHRNQSENEVNGTPLYRIFENKSSEYCQLFFGGVCQRPLRGCGFNSDCPPEHNCLDAPETDLGYKCVQKRYGGIVIVGGNTVASTRCEAIGTSEPPAYPVNVTGNTLSLVGSTLYSCGGTSNVNVCRYLGMNDTTWNSFDIPWSLSYHSAVTVANDIWFFTDSKLYIYHTDRSNQNHSSYDTPFHSGRFTSCAVSNGSHTFVIGRNSNISQIWLNKDTSNPAKWEKLADMKEKRISHSCLWFGSQIFVSGGRAEVESPSISSVEVIDVENFAVRSISPLQEARRGHQMAVLHGKPAVLGGQILTDTTMKSIETYDPQTESWHTLNYTLRENNSYVGLAQYQI